MTSFATSSHTRTATRISIGSAVLALGIGLAGCGAVESWDKATSDAWAVTYEVTVTGGTSNSLKDVSYLEAEKRGEDSTSVTEESVSTSEATGKKKNKVWSIESMVTAQKDASVAATPDKDGTATCRVLLDGVKEIASATGAPGERVQCDVTTPAFKE
ncbi:hypothetical protein OF385_15025 [Glutamicibacter sp. JL.03c]|uniref:hypothetical protein n=1 Tax=Glutamicibacter sp. JL.03c TaxID=2984842 RepID=UPI0021F6E160|nr:hypothetical protein [Glutamicibacter sp. JL.03c]UYQ77314.1 hypothetical protein OF385_15025 [Glutamicibacter sp. JL.03c]